MGLYFILKDREPVATEDVLEWARFFEQSEQRRVGDSMVGEWRVSTVFTGIDHHFGMGKKPLLFETMIFGGPFTHQMQRSATWAEATEQHTATVMRLRKSLS